jgi:DNA-binding transcriptional LysR family regulator
MKDMRESPPPRPWPAFESAARHSYTKAAQELSLTQSAVSRQIIALEEFVGVALFKRTRHGVLLTDAGRITPSRWPLAAGAGARHAGSDGHQGEGGPINLAAVPTFATRWLLPRLPQLAQPRHHVCTSMCRPGPFCLPTPVSTPPCTPARPSRWPAGPACRRSG